MRAPRALAFALALAAVAGASSLTIPNTFAPGQTASASAVNANFAAIAAAVNDNHARITALEAPRPAPVELMLTSTTSTSGDVLTLPIVRQKRYRVTAQVRTTRASSTTSAWSATLKQGTQTIARAAGDAGDDVSVTMSTTWTAGTTSLALAVTLPSSVSCVATGDRSGTYLVLEELP